MGSEPLVSRVTIPKAKALRKERYGICRWRYARHAVPHGAPSTEAPRRWSLSQARAGSSLVEWPAGLLTTGLPKLSRPLRGPYS